MVHSAHDDPSPPAASADTAASDTYAQQLHDEAELWGTAFAEQAQDVPPDWRFHRALRHNAVTHTDDIDALLERIQPGMQTLELGCGSGWLTLAMAQRGADATGYDIGEKSLAVARDYYARIADTVSGSATYEYADLNYIDLPANHYDVVVIKGTLHHLMRMDHVIAQVHQALTPGGLLWIEDSLGDPPLPAVLIASALMFVLPTHTSYADKVQGLLRFGVNAPDRIRASMEADGLSPFEGAGRTHNWLQLVQERFSIDRQTRIPTIAGYISAQLALSDTVAIPFLRGLYKLEQQALQLGILGSPAYVVIARK